MIDRKEFYFLRHGQTNHNAKMILAGSDCDVSLNNRGKEQSISLRSILSLLPVRSICYSPLKRAKETMNLAASKIVCDRIQVETLKECRAEIWKKMIKLGRETNPCDQVESFFSQVRDGINRALEYSNPVLIIAHGGVHWALCRLLMIDGHRWDLGNCELAHFKPINQKDWEVSKLISERVSS